MPPAGIELRTFGLQRSRVSHVIHCASKTTLEATNTYKYLGITLNTKGDLTDHLKITKGKTLTTTQTIINLASSNRLKDIQMETIWKLYKACTLPMITYGSEAWIMTNQEKKQIQSINNKNLRTILSTPNTTPGIALRTETTLADISQEINIKQINYLLKQMNRGTNEHIRNSIWERKINTVCTHHNIDINHFHTLEKQQQRAELKRRMQTSRTEMLLTLSDPGYFRQLSPPPYDLGNYCVDLHHIIHVNFTRCFWHDPIGIFFKIRDFDHFTAISK